jgi:hypothetical protein
MEIILFEKKYSIDVDRIVFELDNQLSKNLEFSPGVSKEDFEKYPKDNKLMFEWLIKKIIVLFLKIDELVINHSDHLTNLELNIRSLFSDIPISIVDSPDLKNIVPSQYIKEIVRFNDQFVREFQSIFFPEFEKSIYRRIDKLEENSNLTYLKIINDFSDRCIPNYFQDYRSPFFDFLKDYIKLLNPPELSKSILVTSMTKTDFEEYLDHLFPGKEILNKDVKKHLKSWFHYNRNEEKDIEPMYFDDNDDEPYYIAYVLKFSGITQEKKTKFNVLAYIKKSNEWLDNNLLSRKSESRFSNFAELDGLLEKYSREIVKKEIDSNLETYKLQKKKPK